MTQAMRERIKRSVTINENGCWDWIYRKDRHGYGKLSMRPNPKLAHRVAYEAFVGPIKDGYTIDHLCFNKICCNPEHLECVTASVNTARSNKRRGEKKRP